MGFYIYIETSFCVDSVSHVLILSIYVVSKFTDLESDLESDLDASELESDKKR